MRMNAPVEWKEKKRWIGSRLDMLHLDVIFQNYLSNAKGQEKWNSRQSKQEEE